MKYNYIFGPVISRRLGVSLGVDIIPPKTCDLNCIYCECGKTTDLSVERKEFFPVQKIIDELSNCLDQNPKLDVVTFGGSGEPLLNSSLGTIVRFVKQKYAYKTALLTNGTLLYLPEVAEALMPFDFILPSLDAVSNEVFGRINQAHSSLDNQRIIEGLITFSHRYTGTLWLEVFIVPGINDTPDELSRFKNILEKIRADRIQLNTLDRPGAYDWVKPATVNRLEEIAVFFQPLPIEIISRNYTKKDVAGHTGSSMQLTEQIHTILMRRPCTLEDLSRTCGKSAGELTATLNTLIVQGAISVDNVGNEFFYKLTSK